MAQVEKASSVFSYGRGVIQMRGDGRKPKEF